jgi:predicted amidohydrolase
VKIALAQIDVAFGDVERNLATVKRRTEEAAAKGAQLVVFPECALTGYAFDSLEAARAVAIPAPGPATAELRRTCAATGVHLVVGTLERDGDRVFNTALLIGPDATHGLLLKYRKVHLPVLGCDRFATPGDLPFEVAETKLGKIGLAICYDGSFPESARVLKLRGAQLIVLPTNWPEQATVSRQYQSIVRAFENHVNYVACNRVGSEAGFTFPGGSQIVDFTGKVLANAAGGEQILFAELDLPAADKNRIVNVPRLYELDRIAHRRPEFYGPVVEPNLCGP